MILQSSIQYPLLNNLPRNLLSKPRKSGNEQSCMSNPGNFWKTISISSIEISKYFFKALEAFVKRSKLQVKPKDRSEDPKSISINNLSNSSTIFPNIFFKTVEVFMKWSKLHYKPQNLPEDPINLNLEIPNNSSKLWKS